MSLVFQIIAFELVVVNSPYYDENIRDWSERVSKVVEVVYWSPATAWKRETMAQSLSF